MMRHALAVLVLVGAALAQQPAASQPSKAVTAASGSLFHPGSVQQMKALDLPADGAITFDTDTLTVSGTASGQGALGLCEGGKVEVALFAFESLHLRRGSKVTVTGKRAIALLSPGEIRIDTAIDLSGQKGTTAVNSDTGAAPGAGGFAGGPPRKDSGVPGQGPGAGFNQRVKGGAAGGGGAHGGAGGDSSPADGGKGPMRGGKPYGDAPITQLLGGSGGAGGSHDRMFNAPGGGGGGGGALAVISLKAIHLGPDGRLIAKGGDGADKPCSGGGGAGGAILLAAPTVTLDPKAIVSAAGGHAGKGGQGKGVGPTNGRQNVGHGGGGGGGRIAIYCDTGVAGLPAGVSVAAGKGDAPGQDGTAGTFHHGPWPGLR